MQCKKIMHVYTNILKCLSTVEETKEIASKLLRTTIGRAPKPASPSASAKALPKGHFENGFIPEAGEEAQNGLQ